jgi:hypothetical protein
VTCLPTDRLDLLGIAAVGREILGEAFERGGILALGDEQHGPLIRIGHQGDVVVPAQLGGLVHRDVAHCAPVPLGGGQVRIALADRHRVVGREVDHLRHPGERHVAAHPDDEGLEQPGEAG